MTDKFTQAKRSEIMSRIGGRNTKPELAVRSMLHALGYRFRVHSDKLPGKPDIYLPKYNTVIFVHGCYWHRHEGCPRASIPQTNKEFWKKKFDGNIKRDALIVEKLKAIGWESLIIWQCELRNINTLQSKLKHHLQKPRGR